VLRPRMLAALVVAGAGLATAIWLPTRNDTAAASDRDRGNHQSRDDRWYDRDDNDHRRDGARNDGRNGNNDNGRDRADPTPTTEAPTPPPEETVAPTGEPTAPPVSEPTTAPTTEPPATEPPATEPPTTTPPATPPATDPVAAVTEWEPFINYVEGDIVRFDGIEYQVLQSHTSLPGWEPAALTVIFKPLL
jgi:hypothetical protein